MCTTFMEAACSLHTIVNDSELIVFCDQIMSHITCDGRQLISALLAR